MGFIQLLFKKSVELAVKELQKFISVFGRPTTKQMYYLLLVATMKCNIRAALWCATFRLRGKHISLLQPISAVIVRMPALG